MAKSLVLYYSATGTTKAVAEKVAQQLGADMAEIHPITPYSSGLRPRVIPLTTVPRVTLPGRSSKTAMI